MTRVMRRVDNTRSYQSKQHTLERKQQRATKRLNAGGTK